MFHDGITHHVHYTHTPPSPTPHHHPPTETKLKRSDSLARLISRRPSKDELVGRNILSEVSEEERKQAKVMIETKLDRSVFLIHHSFIFPVVHFFSVIWLHSSIHHHLLLLPFPSFFPSFFFFFFFFLFFFFFFFSFSTSLFSSSLSDD